MLIRSQDKKTIKYFGDRDTIYILDSTIFIDGSVYGEYSTEEKAIKVLDMITTAYAAESIGHCMLDANKKIIDGLTEDGLRVLANSYRKTCVFQMPQDSEVEA